MINRPLLQKMNFKKPESWIATWFGCGLMAKAPGTWGTLGALPLGVLLMYLGGNAALWAGLAVIIPLGWWAAGKVETMTGEHDGGYIVVDEVAGLWIALLAASLTPLSLILAFALFRLFDIFKPFPCNWLDQKLDGAASVMLDDIAAGVYAALSMVLLAYVGIGA